MAITGVSVSAKEGVEIRSLGVFTQAGVLAGGAGVDIKGLLKQRGRTSQWTLPPRHTLVLEAEILSSREENHDGEVVVSAESGNLRLPLTYFTLEGGLQIEPLANFEPGFPGSTTRQFIFATSSYQFAFKLQNLTSSDPMMVPTLTNNTLHPGVRTRIGRVLFDPLRGKDGNYLGSFPWAHNHKPSSHADAKEVARMHSLARAWRTMQTGRVAVEADVIISAELGIQTTFKAKAALMRPEVLPGGRTVTFTHTQVPLNPHP